MEISKDKYAGMPPQKLVDKAKNKEWVKANFEGIMYMSSSAVNGRSSRYEKQTLYDLVNSKFNEEDFKYVTDAYGLEEANVGSQPAILRNYNIIRDKIELLKGEEAKLPFNWNVVGSYGEIIREKDEALKTELLGSIQKALASAVQGQEVEVPGLEEIQTKYKIKHLDIREKNASHIIRQVFEKENLKDKFNDGWEHALISAEEIYYVGKRNGRPVVRVVNPLNVEYDKDPDLKYIHKGNWFREERIMSVSSILDEYGEFLEDSDIEKLDKGMLSSSMYSMYRNSNYFSNMAPNSKYQPGENIPLDKMGEFGTWEPSSHNLQASTQDGIVVTSMVWSSMRRMDYLTFIDPNTGEEVTEYVPQDFKLTSELKKAGAYIESEWIKDVWKATGWGTGESLTIVDYGPLENQTGDLPYVGYVYNNTNSKATSLVDLAKAYQYDYMIIMYKIMTEVAKFKGAKLIFDIAQIPTTGVNGMSQEKWLYYFDVVGIGWVNSFEEGQEGSSTGQRATFNQFQMVQDKTLEAIQPLILMLDKIENQVQSVLGVSDQRLGAIGSSETVGGVERSVIQSSAITASLFMKHNQVKKYVLQQVLEVGKLCVLEDDAATQLMVDDIYRELVKIDANQLNDSEYDVLVSDSIEIATIKESLKAIAPQAIQADKLNYSEYIKLLQSYSISEITAIIKQGEEDKYARDAAAQEAQAKEGEANREMQMTLAREQADREDNNKQLDRENKIQVAALGAMRSKDGPTDLNQDGIPDPIQMGQLAIKQSELQFKQTLESQKLQNEAVKHQASVEDSNRKYELDSRKLAIEEAKLNAGFSESQVKLNLQANENKQQDIHKKLDLKENEKDRALKLKELDKKEKLERFKVKMKPKPKAPAKKTSKPKPKKK